MGFTRRSNGHGTVKAVECEAFAEVIYEDASVLVVNLATGIEHDHDLNDALMDAIAMNEQRDEAELAITNLATVYGIDVHADEGPDLRALTLALPVGVTAAAAGGARR
jgi:hypothetical protein